MPIRNRPRLVASASSTTKLFVDDLREVASLSRDEGRPRSDVIRELVHEALRLRRLRAIGRDEGENFVRRIQQEVFAEGIGPVTQRLAELRETLEKISANDPCQTVSPIRPGADETGLRLAGQMLRRMILTESIARVLMTIGMQRDGMSPEEIRKQLVFHEESARREAQQLISSAAIDFAWNPQNEEEFVNR